MFACSALPDRAEGRRVDDVEGVLPGRVQTELAPPAQLVKTNRSKGTEEPQAGGQRIEQRNDVVSKGCAAERETDDGIDRAQENDMGRHFPEIVQVFRH